VAHDMSSPAGLLGFVWQQRNMRYSASMGGIFSLLPLRGHCSSIIRVPNTSSSCYISNLSTRSNVSLDEIHLGKVDHKVTAALIFAAALKPVTDIFESS
jgi:hypothetical protein